MITHRSERAEHVKQAQWARIKELRAQAEQAPIATRWGVFQFDDKSRQRLQSVVEACGSAWIAWRDVDNTAIELSPGDLTALYYDLIALSGRRVLDLGEFTQRLRERLPLAVDDPVLRGEGWPGI